MARTTFDLTREECEAILAAAQRRDARPVARIPAIPESDFCPECGWYLPDGGHGAC